MFADAHGFKLLEKLGEGSSCIVYKALHIGSDQLVALKCIRKQKSSIAHIKREISIMKSLDCPFIATYYDSFEDDQFFYISMELCDRGSLLDFINVQYRLPEKSIKKILSQLVIVLDYLHNKMKIAHRDLKAENIMFDKHFNIRVIDLGFSEYFDEKRSFNEFCGSPNYIAPEIVLRSQYGPKVDIWSLGVLLYTMTIGKFPFCDENINNLMKKILYSTVQFPDDANEEIVELINGMLDRDPDTRMTIEQLMENKWLNFSSDDSIYKKISVSTELFINPSHLSDEEIGMTFERLTGDKNKVIEAIRSGSDHDSMVVYRILRNNQIVNSLNDIINPISLQYQAWNIQSSPKFYNGTKANMPPTCSNSALAPFLKYAKNHVAMHGVTANPPRKQILLVPNSKNSPILPKL